MAKFASTELLDFKVKELELKSPSNDATSTLESVMEIMQELTSWLVKSGVGYTEFSTALKPLFYNEAIRESDYIKQKKTDSSLSLLSGLHRRDVSAYRQENNGHYLIDTLEAYTPMSIAARVVSTWIKSNLAHKLPITGIDSFEALVKTISTEKHPRSVLSELKRLGMVIEEGEHISLQSTCFKPRPDLIQSKKIFSANIADHLSAGIHNLIQKDDAFLEQAIFAESLSQKSIDQLKVLSEQLWGEMSEKILSSAIKCSQKDFGKESANQRFRVGIFCYDEKLNKS